MNTKAQGISINVIIVAIIALLVLVVLTVIFGGRMGLWNEQVGEQSSSKCTDNTDAIVRAFDQSCPEGYTASLGNYEDVPAGKKCCIPEYS